MKMQPVFVVWFLPVVPLIYEKASTVWQQLSAISTDKIRLKRETSSYFVENVLIDARDSYGWAQDFYFFTNDLKRGDYPGRETHKRLQILRKNNTSIL